MNCGVTDKATEEFSIQIQIYMQYGDINTDTEGLVIQIQRD